MIRNLVSKLPGLKCASDYAFSSSLRKRNFRSLSPVKRVRTCVGSERSVSCSRVENSHIVDITRTPRARTLCFSKEYYAQKHDNIKEIPWREAPKRNKEPEIKEEGKKTDSLQFETLEQYELEAAKPRPARSRDIIEAFATAKPADDGFFHLQPSQIQPYGSQNNMYSPSLIRPTNLLKYPRKFKRKKELQEHERKSRNDLDSSGYRNYSTSSEVRQLSTSKIYVAKEGCSSKDTTLSGKSINKLQKNIDNLNFLANAKQAGETNFDIFKRVSQSYKEPWAEPKQRLNFSPPIFQPNNNTEIEMPFKFSTSEMRRKRKEKENENRDHYYKSSYSDLVKLKLKELEEEKLNLLDSSSLNPETASNKSCLRALVKNIPKSSKILQVPKNPPEQRSLTTRSKSNLLSKKFSPTMLDPKMKSTLLSRTPVDDSQNQRNYSNSKTKNKKEKKAKKYSEAIDHEAGCDVCTPTLKALHKLEKPQIPMEPKTCVHPKPNKKVYLPSNVKLGVPPCTPRPDYKECIKVDPCPPRADECLVITSKKLPKLPPSNCVCVEQHMPNKAPKLEKLNFKFEDPPKVPCHVPPCQTPRADDGNPYKFKPLKPYVPGDCDCVQSPPMKDVKLKRLPRCEPEEVCRPVRVCPVKEKCPPRADECLKIVPKELPPIEPSPCPCINPPVPKLSPPIRRLDLRVPEPPRVCPRPPTCREKERADDNMKLKRRKLPKFVPGDCPCEDKPMIDWNPKRLVCEDETADCIVPDPCKAFPRADWGCWEYQDEICEAVDVKCIDKKVKCPPPVPPRGHPCDKYNICADDSAGLKEIRHIPKRRYSHSSASLKLYEQVKSQNIVEDNGYIKTSANTYKPPEIKQSKSKTKKIGKDQKDVKINTRKLKSKSALILVRMLNELDRSKKDSEDNLLFKPIPDEKVNYDQILKKIAASSTTLQTNKKEPRAGSLAPTLKRSKSSSTLKVTSRAISTSKTILKDEKDIKNEKDCQGKKKCKNLKPSIKAMMCKKKCPTLTTCRTTMREHRPSCKFERVPVCCEKEEPPYSAFTDNLEESITPYTKTPQWTCNRVRYGFHPNFKKEHEPLDKSKKKDKKSFSTCTVGPEFAANNDSHIITDCPPARLSTTTMNARLMSNKTLRSIPIKSTKELLKMSTYNNVIITQNRALSSRIFQIRPPTPSKPKPNKKCVDKSLDVGKSDKIACTSHPEIPKPRWCCKREPIDPDCKRKPPPFPAFSDCLDEEMEDILTECPLDKEKYLRMQPRFMNQTKKPFTLKPPPPNQGKLDLLKEQACIREKLCIENEGLTQSCSDFGKPIPLMKAKKLIKSNRWDCQRMEELKKQGRWPPRTLKQNRRIYTSASAIPAESCRNLSTLGLSFLSEVSTDNLSLPGVKRLYIRNYHALVKGSDKALLVVNEAKLKELTKKIFPDIDESTKLLKLRKNQWRMQNLKNHEQLNHQCNLAKRVRRFYTTYRIKHKNFLRGQSKGCTLKTYLVRRRVSNNGRILKYNFTNLRGSRSLKSGRPSNNTKRERSQGETNKKGPSKFTLNNGSKVEKKDGNRKASGTYGHKPFSPFPAFSERKKAFSRSSDAKNIQPSYSILTDNTNAQKFPEQEKIDRSKGLEYYKCKHGLKDEGITLDCQSLGFCPNSKDSDDCHNGKSKCNSRSSVIELFVQEHKKQKANAINYCKQSKAKAGGNQGKAKTVGDECAEDRQKIENICMEHCLKCIPCHLPEEEKYCVCKEECKKIFQSKLFEEAEPTKCKEKEKICSSDELENEDCQVELEKQTPCPKPAKITCNKVKSDCSDKCSTTSKAVICPPAPCGPKKSKSFTQLENFWQKIVNYFKARPNCPEPGEWKKKALKEKAEKAAKAAGLVALNPKCLPPEILRTAKVSKDCKICPNKDPCDKKDCDCDPNKSASPRLSRRNFSTVVHPSRNYSGSCENLQEINKLLEESEINERKLKYSNSNPNFKKEFVFSERKDAETSMALKMSLDTKLRRYVDLRELSRKDVPYSRTYFGYSDIIPSRENILERAWRISIESYNKYHYPKTYNFFNEFLNKIEKSIQSVEDLEKLKTENVLRELDEFLKNHDSDKNKK